MSTGIVKKARGRPPKSSVPTIKQEVESLESNRQYDSGRASMSLRPNKRVRLTKDDYDYSNLDEDEYVVPDNTADENSEEYFGEDFDTNDDSQYDENMEDLANRDAFQNHRRRSRKMIMYNPKMAVKMRKEQLEKVNNDGVESQKVNVFNSTYFQNKEQICLRCCNELNPKQMEKSSDIFTGLTKQGKSLKDLVSSLIKEEIDETMIGRKLCQQCFSLLNQIEHHFSQFRSLSDQFLDGYTLGQKSLDADLGGFEEVGDLTSMLGALSLPLGDIMIKVFDDSIDTFEASYVGHQDFNCQVKNVYAGSIQSSSTMPNPEPTDNNEMVTITFDYTTGAITRAETYARAQLNIAQMEEKDIGVVLYMIESEFEALNKVHAEQKIFISLEEFSRLAPTVLLGHKSTWLQMILSSTLANEYKRIIPSAQHPFCCCDCGASFHHLHMLTNHVQVAHVESTNHNDEQKFDLTENNGDDLGNGSAGGQKIDDATRTGEIATLEKPFQCEICDKCFSHYLNYSNHVEHYHGFNRKCNLQDCATNTKSIQEFVQHYVRHMNPDFMCPTDFKEKTSVALPCPHCNSMINGIWRLYNHSFIHDPQPRFKCPICPKRFAKVQNFKIHIIKHVAPTNSKVKHCRHCNQLIPVGDFSKHLQEKHEVVLPYQCNQCNLGFSRESFLKQHQEKHLSKQDWVWNCRICPQTFPSETRLLSHESNQHSIEHSPCKHCPRKGFTSKKDLIMHETHEHNTKIYSCSVCGVRVESVWAARSHFRESHSEKPLYCHLCHNAFSSMIQVHHHLSTHHPDLVGTIVDNQPEFKCLFCGKTMSTALALQHLRMEHLSQTLETTTEDDYQKLSQDFGDHIIEYLSEDTNEVIRIHSIL